MTTDPELAELEQSFLELAAALFTNPSTPAETVRRIVALAVDTVVGCEAAGILMATDEGVTTAASTSDTVLELHRLQVEAQAGPCFDAVVAGAAQFAQDLAGESRWPGFSSDAVALGVRSVLAFPLTTQRPSALNLYAALPAAFGAGDRAKALVLATFAGVAIDAATALATETRRAANLTEALLTRELIGQAQGILMERERITSEQAFALLRDSSQHLNVKLREVARTLIETGETPETGAGH